MNKDRQAFSVILKFWTIAKYTKGIICASIIIFHGNRVFVIYWRYRHNNNEKLHKGVLAASVIGSIILLLLIGKF